VSKKTLFVLLIVLLIVLAPYTILPPMMGSLVGRILQDQLGLQKTPQVAVQSSPGLMMYAGSFSKALVSVAGLEFAGVKTDRIVMVLDPFNVNIIESATGSELSTEKPLSGVLRGEFSEANTLRLAQLGAGVPVQEIQLEDDEVVLKMAVGLGSPATVRGRLFLQDGSLVFEPRQIEGAPQQLLAVVGFAYPVSGLPFGAEISGVDVRKDRLILSARLQKIPLGEPIG
jgi:LmeA-like phospholipid-binding